MSTTESNGAWDLPPSRATLAIVAGAVATVAAGWVEARTILMLYWIENLVVTLFGLRARAHDRLSRHRAPATTLLGVALGAWMVHGLFLWFLHTDLTAPLDAGAPARPGLLGWLGAEAAFALAVIVALHAIAGRRDPARRGSPRSCASRTFSSP